jgi:RNA polymerase sigma factor (sigma-70 family)
VAGDANSGDTSDRMAELIAGLAGRTLSAADTRELHTAIHAAVYPMCLRLLGGPDAAADAEQELWRRLLETVQRRDFTTDPIRNGTAYVRQAARNVCNDMGRRAGDRRREVPVDEHTDDVDRSGARPAGPERVVFPLLGPADELLVSMFGYTSQQIRADLAGLSEEEQLVLALRQQDMSYLEIAAELGGGASAGTLQRRGERAVQHLRGRIQVTVWRQDPVAGWDLPECASMRRLKLQVKALLLNDRAISATMFREIGKHLDPHPNRSQARGDDPVCAVCRLERVQTEQLYGVLVALLPPLLDLPERPGRDRDGNLRPVPVRRRKDREPGVGAVGQFIGTMIGVLLVITCIGCGVYIVRTTDFDAPTASPSPSPAVTGGSRRPTPAADLVPSACTLVTPAEVGRSLGGATFGACKGDASPQPGAAPRIASAANFARPAAVAGRAI